MVPEIPEKDLPLLRRIEATQGDEAAYWARFDLARRAAKPSPDEIEFRRRMAEQERLILGYSTCDKGKWAW